MYNMIKNSVTPLVASLGSQIIKTILNVLAQMSIYIRKHKDNLSNTELTVVIENDSFFSFVKNSFSTDQHTNKINQYIIFDELKIDGLYTFFNLLKYKIKELDEPIDLSIDSLFVFIIASGNFDNAVLLSRYFPTFLKQLVFYILSQYFKTFNINKGKLKSPVRLRNIFKQFYLHGKPNEVLAVRKL